MSKGAPIVDLRNFREVERRTGSAERRRRVGCWWKGLGRERGKGMDAGVSDTYFEMCGEVLLYSGR